MIRNYLRKHFFYSILLIALIFPCFNALNAFADVIIDNGDSGTSFTGTWRVSGGSNPYGTDSLWSRDGSTYTWQFDSQPSGTYEVLMRWSGYSSRATDIAVDINHRDGQSTTNINQQENAGQWNSLGQYYFDSSGSVTITTAYGSTVSTCADAVWFRSISQPTEIIIDNRDSSTSQTGTWNVSGGADPYNSDSVYSRDGTTFTWHFTPPQTGNYTFSMYWTWWSSRSTNVPVDIEYSGGTARIFINQQENAGQWNSLGDYPFESGSSYSITITSQPAPSSTCADAVKFNYIQSGPIDPVANDDSATTTVGTPVTINLIANDMDIDGTIDPATVVVTSGPSNGSVEIIGDGTIIYTPEAGFIGTDTLMYTVQDNDGATSNEATVTITVREELIEEIIDNRGTNTSFTGTWRISGASNPYGVDSYWSRDGDTFTWIFSPTVSGYHELSMWCTAWPSRSTNVPVDIEYSGGTTRVHINQQQGGVDWIGLGGYLFESGRTYDVTITAQPGPSSTCADAVKFVYMSGVNIPPVATIDSILPNPAPPGEEVTFIGYGTDSDGTIEGYRWRSSLDGNLSESATFSKSDLSEGTHTIFFTVQDNDGTWSQEASDSLVISQVPMTEHIYACPGYASVDATPGLISMLQDIGAYIENDLWKYRNEDQNKDYIIHFVQDIEGMKQALKSEGAHVLYFGHSNYGLGAIFATQDEFDEQLIEDIRYIDDDRIFNYSSPWIHVNVRGMRTGQAYPYWWPVFKDGTSGIMPYDFDDPGGDPAYNYYMTYQIPGDPTYYKIETVRNSALERFPDSETPAWYSPDGTPPDPSNPEHLQYFITNPEPWYPSFESSGDWRESRVIPGYFRENYQYTPAGQGDDWVRWIFNIPETGNYKVFAWWSASQARTPDAPYTINHADGNTTVRVDQRVDGGQWNEIGEYYFNADEEYYVRLNDDANAGNVVADAVRITHADNPPEIIQADFYARTLYGPTPLDVSFVNQSTGDFTERHWDFGDGKTNITRDWVLHTYTEPGIYTVSLTVSGHLGSNTKTKTGYIIVGDTTPVLRAEFSAYSRVGDIPLDVSFRDRSSGDNIVSWLWDFGDDETSSEQNPTHTYSLPDNYIVSLTVTDANGNSNTETKENFVTSVIFEEKIDNVDYPKTHYRNKTILFRKDPEILKEELKYDRMLYIGCDSGHYFTDTFQRGIMFYAVSSSSTGGTGMSLYLRAYLEGKSDYEIWEVLQDLQPIYDYYNFNKSPSEQ